MERVVSGHSLYSYHFIHTYLPSPAAITPDQRYYIRTQEHSGKGRTTRFIAFSFPSLDTSLYDQRDMSETLPLPLALPVPNLRSRISKSHPTTTTTLTSDPKYSPSAGSTASLSSIPSAESIEDEEKKFDDPYPDFLWMTTEEPHRSRRMAILKAHPEVRLLYARDNRARLTSRSVS
jgi:hypothetical protein